MKYKLPLFMIAALLIFLSAHGQPMPGESLKKHFNGPLKISQVNPKFYAALVLRATAGAMFYRRRRDSLPAIRHLSQIL